MEPLAHFYEEGKRSYEEGKRSYEEGKRSYEEGKRSYEEGKRSYEEGKRSGFRHILSRDLLIEQSVSQGYLRDLILIFP
jgi:hypothetical protein